MKHWRLCFPAEATPTMTSAARVGEAEIIYVFVVVVLFREKMFLWHLKLVFPQSNTEFSQRR